MSVLHSILDGVREDVAIREAETPLDEVKGRARRMPSARDGLAAGPKNDRLRERISQFYARLESQIKQVLREAQIRENLKPSISAAALTSLLLAAVEGRLAAFVRSEFKQSPLEHWDIQWPYLSANLMMPFGVDDGFGSNAPV